MIKPEDIKGTDEKSEQTRVFAWAAINQSRYPQLRWLHAIPNANSQRQVAEGVRAGIPDICLPWPSKGYHALYIELKIKTGKVSQKQNLCIDYLNSVGYKAIICWSYTEAIKILENYCAV